MRTGLAAALWALLAASLALGQSDPLNHYGVATLADKQIEEAFTSRFNAQGRPLFLIGDSRRGIAIGDIVRFKSKVILIDEEVWQTMKTTGVLDAIRNAPVVELTAQSSSEVWKSRAELAEGREKIAYTLGSEFITILEDYFGNIPKHAEIGFRFEGNKMSVMAPVEMLGMLKFIGKPGGEKKEPPKTQPVIVSEPPRPAFVGQPFAWTVWAVDRGAPSSELDYSLASALPPGLRWNDGNHAITGQPEKAGTWKVRVKAVNAGKRSDELAFDLTALVNGRPRIWGEPAREAGGDGSWRFQPFVADPDHPLSELKVKAFSLPGDMVFEAATRTFVVRDADAARIAQLTFGLEVTDPLGASDKRTFSLASPTGLRFASALTTNELLEGQVSFYQPVAQGPGNDIRYAVRDAESGSVDLEGGRIPLPTRAPGSYLMEISAEDELGNRAQQMIAYQVLPHEGLRQNLRLDARQLSDGMNFNAYYRVGRARFGALHTETGLNSLPFLFAGFEPLPASVGGGKHRLFLDMGFNFQGASGVTHGGFMLRLDGQYHTLRESNLMFRYTAQYYARQGIVLFDPKAFRENDLGNAKLEKCLSDLRASTDRPDSLMAGFRRCDESVNKILESYEDPDNEVFFVELMLARRMWRNLGLGPVYWLEDHFHSNWAFEQRVGAALTHEGSFPWFGYGAALKVGFGPGNPAAKVLFDLSLHFGRPD